jgi:phospholipid/cholesterol/gamma-HCH transport system substrate-binding protein
VPAEGGEQLLMAKMSATVSRAVIGAIVAVIVVAAAAYFVLGGSSSKKVTAQFTSAVGVYAGTPVRILGVNVGRVTGVHPTGDYVEVTMTYDSKYTLPKNVTAVEVANSLVSDRYIQLTPAWNTSRAAKVALPSGATIGVDRTDGPAELDDIYAALDKLAVALGPEGANQGGKQSGALSELLRVSAANLKGNGTALGNSITNLARAAETLSGHRGDLFDTVQNLQKFTKTLQASDGEVRKFNTLLAQVAGDLASERGDLGAAIKQLGLTLDTVSQFVKSNAGKFHEDIVGLEQLTGLLVREKASLNETLAIAPYALANIIHAYQPDLGALATRGNLVSLTRIDPAQIVCGLLTTAPGGLGELIKGLPLNIGNQVTQLCKGKTGATNTAGGSSGASGGTIGGLIPGVNAPGLLGGGK